jgi:adenylate cyclase
MKKILKKALIGVIGGVAVSILITLFMKSMFPGLTELWQNLENKTYDLRYFFKYLDQKNESLSLSQGVQSVFQAEDVVILDIDERSMLAGNMGLYYRWPRSVHSDLVQYLKSGNNAVTAFDIHFNDADYGKKETDRILGILTSSGGGEYRKLEPIIHRGVNFDSIFVEGTRRAGNVIHAMILNNVIAYANKSDYEERATEKHFEESNPASTTKMEASLMERLPNFPVLDGAYPELAQAANRIGLVNVDPDADGIHRTIPLLARFRNHVFPALSLQTCLWVMGKTLSEVKFVPGQTLDIGRPFYVEKESDDSLKISYPGINGMMVRALLSRADEIRSLKEGGNLLITPKMTVARDIKGAVTLDIPEGTLSFSTLRDLNGLTAEQLKGVPLNQPAPITDATGLLRTGDAEYSIVEIQNNEKSIESVPAATVLLIASLDGKRVMALKTGETWNVSENLTVSKKAAGLSTEYVLLRGKVLDELLKKKPGDLESLKPGSRLEFGEPIRIPVDATGRMRLNYVGQARVTFKTISYYDIWAKRVPPEYFCGKIFLVGCAAISMGDLVNAPVGKTYPGVEVHATAMTDILNNNFMKDPDKGTMFLIVLALAILMCAAAMFIKPFLSVILAVLISLGYFVAAMQWFNGNLNLEVVRPVFCVFGSYLGAVLYRYITEEKDKKFLKATFSNYLSSELIDQMYENKRFPELGGEESVCTAFFTDIQGFSTFSEKLGSATRIVELLNEYLSGMTDILMQNGGTLDKYIGDAIVAIFGAPLKLADHAEKACRTAIGMQNKLVELRAKWKSEGDQWPETVHLMRMRIGINTGTIVTGNMGSKKRMNYTMMGDPVNLAARLESASKQYGVFTMISDATMDLVGGKFDSRTLDKMIVMGKSEPVTVFEILSEKGKADPQAIEIFRHFEEGLAFYRKQEWDKALEIFSKNAKLEKAWRPDQKTNPSSLYMGRCEQFKQSPPGADWDGVYKLTSK